jgi:hypothetical protein
MQSALARRLHPRDELVAPSEGQTPTYLENIDFGRGMVPENLVIRNNVTNPLYQVDVDCDAVKVGGVLTTSVNLTLDITVSGVGGLDTGSEAANTWYYIWLIYNPTTSTLSGVLSTSALSPSMPAGYEFKRIVGAVRNNASSNFYLFRQVDRTVMYDEVPTSMAVLSGGTALTFTQVDVRAFMPYLCSAMFRFSLLIQDPTTDSGVVAYLRPNGFTNMTSFVYFTSGVQGGSQSNNLLYVEVDMLVWDGYLQYSMTSASESMYIYALGYELNLW